MRIRKRYIIISKVRRSQLRGLKGTALMCLIACICMCFMSMTAFAANEYTVTFRTGSKGTFSDGSTKLSKSVEYGTSYQSIIPEVKLSSDSIYYFKGWNKDIPNEVTGRMELVAEYGVILDAVEYTVEFVDASGVAIATPIIKKGNLNDKITVYAKNVEGYSIDGLSKEIQLINKNNKVIFSYTQVNKTQSAITTTIGDNSNLVNTNSSTQSSTDNTNTQGNNTSDNEDTQTSNSSNSTDSNSATNDNTNTSNNSQNEEKNSNNTDETVNSNEDSDDNKSDVLSEDVANIDDEDVPKADMPEKTINIWIVITSVIGVIMVVAVLLWVIIKHKKKVIE